MGNAKKERSRAYMKQLVSHLAKSMAASDLAEMKANAAIARSVKIGNAVDASKNAHSYANHGVI